MADFSQALHEGYSVYISPDTYVFEPSAPSHHFGAFYPEEKSVGRETLTVDRRTGKMVLNAPDTGAPLGREKVITCFGIVGIISLATTDFIVLITSRTPSCRLLSHPIYLASDFRLLPLSPSSTSSTILDHPIEKELVALVEQGLRAGRLWFSYGWDLTNSLQRQEEGRGAEGGMWRKADDRFFWNKFLMRRFIDQTEMGGKENDLGRFILPLLFGSVELRSSVINNRDILFCLISRRSRYRAGTRYFTRGIDHSGHVANYNETEQIVLVDPLAESGFSATPGRVEGRERSSFVQIRGSVPLFWAEVNNLRYKPDLQIMDVPETIEALRLHVTEQVRIYGDVWLVNLVNNKGHEFPVKDAFEKALTVIANPQAHYIYFDFHHECRKLRFDRIQVLVDQMHDDLAAMSYFHINVAGHGGSAAASGSAEGKVSHRQKGVIRSNCMDCLDRTNVAQAALGKDALIRQLRTTGVLGYKESLDDHAEFMHVFRNVWADHADTISKAYSGTGALKTDFTRTGKRTKEGAIQDGINSVQRYIKNNYYDGSRQDAYDLLTGSWVARRGAIPPLSDTRPLITRAMPYIFGSALTLIGCGLLLPRATDFAISSYMMLWMALAAASFAYIWIHGTSYVNWPRLNAPFEILTYQGPGFRSRANGRGFSGATKMFKGASKKIKGDGLVGTLGVGAGGRKGKVEEIELGRKKGSLID